MPDQDPFAAYAGQGKSDPFAAYAVASAATPSTGELTRVDTNAIGVDHNRVMHSIADASARYLPRSIAPMAATIGTALADIPLSLLEAISAPESIATMGAGGATRPANLPFRAERANTPIRDALRDAGSMIKGTPSGVGGGLTTKAVGAALEHIPVPKTFNDLPLQAQMDSLPTRAAPSERPSMMIRSGAGKMSDVRGNGPANVPGPSRAAMPPFQPQTPFSETPLMQQMRELPQRPAPVMTRTGGPPFQPQTPFHELPLYQQMAQMADTPGGVGTSRVGMPMQSAPSPGLGLTMKAVEDAVRANKLSPDAATKLLKQIQMSQLTKIGSE